MKHAPGSLLSVLTLGLFWTLICLKGQTPSPANPAGQARGPHITTVSPEFGPEGTSITISGSGFGNALSSGIVWLGSMPGAVTMWSDTEIVASVAPNAVTGIARVQQNGTWSNALAFAVSATAAPHLLITPSILNLAVGESHEIRAVGPDGKRQTGITWRSSDPNVVRLSNGDPPLLSAIGPGHATVVAGDSSADVTVSPKTLPGPIWSCVCGVTQIMPAVPSPWGIADVFAFQNNGTVTALTHAGVPAWSATAGPQTTLGLPDFQGGLVLAPQTNYPFLDSITKLDGLTGEAYPSYIPSTGTGLWYASPGIAIHTDGTIFAGLYADPDQNSGSFQGALVAIDPTTGSQKFSVPFSDPSSYVLAGPIVAGDGYAYAAYAYYDEDGVSQHLMLLRADSSGNTDNITIQDFTPPEGFFISLGANLMTNADAGVLLSWSEDFSQPLYRKPADGRAR